MTERNFYIMVPDPPWAGPTVNVLKGPDIVVNEGIFLDDVKGKYDIVLSVDTKANEPTEFPPCDIHGPSRSLLFSQRFINILDSLGVENVQYFDADVTYAPTGERWPYRIANIVGMVSGLDMDKSEVILSRKGNVLEIEVMRLDEENLKGHKIVRLKEDIMLTIVHKSIKKAVEKSGLTGFLFLTDDEFEPGVI